MATSELLAVASEWLASQGAPNWVVLLALLTSPWTWADKIRKRVGPLLDTVLPSGE
jgi:hypothetical protein